MIKNAVQHKRKADLSIAAVQLNTMIRYIFSEQYRLLNSSTYRRGIFHLGYSVFKTQSKQSFYCCCFCWLLSFFVSALENQKLDGKKNKVGKTSRGHECATKWNECNDPLYKIITRHIVLIKYHSRHGILHDAWTT